MSTAVQPSEVQDMAEVREEGARVVPDTVAAAAGDEDRVPIAGVDVALQTRTINVVVRFEAVKHSLEFTP